MWAIAGPPLIVIDSAEAVAANANPPASSPLTDRSARPPNLLTVALIVLSSLLVTSG